MWIVSLKALRKFWTSGNARAEAPLRAWYKLALHAEWHSFNDVHKNFPSADAVKVASKKEVVVFNIGGNACRLIAAVHYKSQRVFVLRVLTHAEYDKEQWKVQL
jgi:mRNA interferase HigB